MLKKFLLISLTVVFLSFLLAAGASVFLGSGNSADSLEKDLTLLSEVPSDFGSVTDFFTDIAKEKGGVYAFDLMRAASLPPNIDMHLLGHTVGDELYKQQGLEGMKHCTDDFRNACSHTIVIGALLENGLQVFDEVNDVCKQAPGGSGAYTMCFHGFGHGVLAFAEYDMEKAVELCERAGTRERNNQEAYECVGGAVMEMKDGIHDKELWEPQREKFVDIENPLSLCQADYMSSGAKERCYSYITPFLFEAVGDGNIPPDPIIYPDSMALCESETDQEHKLHCYAGFGKEFIVFANDLNVQDMESISEERLLKVIDWCSEAPHKSGAIACQTEVVNSLFWGGENDYAVSLRYCALWSEVDSQSCYDQLFSIFDYYHRGKSELRKQFCTDVPKDLQGQCQEVLL